MPESTVALLAALRGGSAAAAWAALAERHGADVWRLIASRLRDAHAAEDAYQDFWLALPAAAARFRPVGDDPERRARAWLMHIAYTTAIDRARRSRPAHAAVADAPEPEDAMPDQEERAELAARVRAAVERLSEAQRQPLLLHIVAGLSYDDLAAELRCTVNNARVKVHRGLAALRGLLGTEAGEVSDQTLAGLIVPVALLVPPPVPALPPPPVAPLVALAKAPAVVCTAIATATAGAITAAVVISSPSKPQEPPVPAIRTLAAAAAATTLVAASGDDFAREAANMNTHDPAVTAELVPAPAGGTGKALRLSWPADHKNFVQCEYTDGFRPAPEITAAGTGVVTVRVWLEAMAGVRGIAIRFTDVHGETFQWAAPMPDPGQAGWRTITVPVIPDQNRGHWGAPKSVDGVIDWPVKLNGYAFDFTKDAPAGSVIVDDVVLSVAKPADK